MNFFVWKNTFPTISIFFDFPNNDNNTTFTFKTWLVSLNCLLAEAFVPFFP